MRPTPFDSTHDYAPIPFDSRVYAAAGKLKEEGLSWRPHVGAFVQDPNGVIKEPSPFPDRVYFILNLNHFITRFGSLDAVARQTIWIPTLHQCRKLLSMLGYDGHPVGDGSADSYLRAYDYLLKCLSQKPVTGKEQ